MKDEIKNGCLIADKTNLTYPQAVWLVSATRVCDNMRVAFGFCPDIESAREKQKELRLQDTNGIYTWWVISRVDNLCIPDAEREIGERER